MGQSEARQQLLQEKLEGNSQRNVRHVYLASLLDDLRDYLSERQFLPMGDFEITAPQFSISHEGFGHSVIKPQSYRLREFAWWHKVIEEVEKLDARHDNQAAVFWPFDGNPIYEVEFGWVRINISDLLNYHLGVIVADSSAGLVIKCHCGYVAGDPNPDEVVYELAVWGFGGPS